MKDFDAILLRHLRGMTFEDTLSLLFDEFNDTCVVVTWVYNKQTMSLGNLAKIRQYHGMDAECVGPIEFWGGPPTKRQHFKGSLLTLLCDRILYCWSVNGEYCNLVQSLPGAEYPIDA